MSAQLRRAHATEQPRRPEADLDRVVAGDGAAGLAALPGDFAHLILSDIPYGIGMDSWDVLHENKNSAYRGSSPAQVKAGAVFKTRGKPINGWSEADRAIPLEYQTWCASWASEWLRVLKPGASALVFAGRRFSHRCIVAMEDAGFSFKDMLAWERPKAVFRAQRLSVVFDRRGNDKAAAAWEGWRVGNLRPSFEPILWFTKPYQIGGTIADNALEHGVGAFNEAAFSRYAPGVDNIIRCGFAPTEGGLHPAQKPVLLMKALIELATKPGQVVIDPFCGSGSTLVAASQLRRRYLGYELSNDYVKIATDRLMEPPLLRSMT